jgi:6-pyruvoyltetrahydropterin/6-carboxytetrahydropterin synthase
MLTITKSVKFDAAHVLTNHKGLCKNLHGHTYRVDVCVSQADGDSSDMVMDFKDVKRICAETVLEKFDHAFIYDETSVGESEIAAVIAKHGMRATALPFRSTAENLAKWIYTELKREIPDLASVKVFETADSCAEYSA